MKKRFTSLDRQDTANCEIRIPDRYRDFESWQSEGPQTVQGAGLSYVAAGFGDSSTVHDMKKFNRILAFNAEEQWLEVEAGATIGDIYFFLKRWNLCIKSLPGYPSVTIGGCIAVNVFGKNQTKEGLFGNCVRSLKLFHPIHVFQSLSPTENPELFDLTVGGLGLTGVMVSAVLSLNKIPGMGVCEKKVEVKNLRECFETLKTYSQSEDLLYSWNNFSANAGGRGFVITGQFCSDEGKGGGARVKKFDLARTCCWPNFYNPLTQKVLNTAYEFLNLKWKAEQTLSYFDYFFPVANKMIYFKLFGKKGFLERQYLIPFEAQDSYLQSFDRIFTKHKPLVTLCSCKIFKGEQRLLHFNGNGIVLTMDLPADDRYLPFHRELYDLNLEHGVIDNFAKDSLIDGPTVQNQYPEFEEFKERLHAWDPERLFQSNLGSRLGL